MVAVVAKITLVHCTPADDRT